MCDGMGWFEPQDYKRMLLLFDRVYYLLPNNLAEFEDVDGRTVSMLFSGTRDREAPYESYAFEPDANDRQLMLGAAHADANDDAFAQSVRAIPQADRLYTWRVVNADAEIGGGRSPGLSPDRDVLAHALLLNKFLLAADRLWCVPITGQAHVHRMLRDKYARGVPYPGGGTANPIPADLAQRTQPIAMQLSRAIVSDDDLALRSEGEIIAFKERHAAAFARFHIALRSIARSIASPPGSREFDAMIREIATLSAWKDADDSRTELRSSWSSFFRSAVRDVAGSVLTMGVSPGLVLVDLVAKSVPDLAISLHDAKKKRAERSDNGLYYLLHFPETPIVRVRD